MVVRDCTQYATVEVEAESKEEAEESAQDWLDNLRSSRHAHGWDRKSLAQHVFDPGLGRGARRHHAVDGAERPVPRGS